MSSSLQEWDVDGAVAGLFFSTSTFVVGATFEVIHCVHCVIHYGICAVGMSIACSYARTHAHARAHTHVSVRIPVTVPQSKGPR